MCVLVLPESVADSLGGDNRKGSVRSRDNRFNRSLELQLTRCLLDLCLDRSVLSIQGEPPSIYTDSGLGLEGYESKILTSLTHDLTHNMSHRTFQVLMTRSLAHDMTH